MCVCFVARGFLKREPALFIHGGLLHRILEPKIIRRAWKRGHTAEEFGLDKSSQRSEKDIGREWNYALQKGSYPPLMVAKASDLQTLAPRIRYARGLLDLCLMAHFENDDDGWLTFVSVPRLAVRMALPREGRGAIQVFSSPKHNFLCAQMVSFSTVYANFEGVTSTATLSGQSEALPRIQHRHPFPRSCYIPKSTIV